MTMCIAMKPNVGSRIAVLTCVLFLSHWCRVWGQQDNSRIDFARDVRPILSDKCFKCHGPDAASRKADLRLDQRKGAQSVLTFEADTPSELVRRISSRDPAEQMPPPGSKLSLSAEEILTLRRWVSQGAVYQGHWAFQSPVSAPFPAVSKQTWPRNEIDYFVLARMESAGMTPSPEALREQLIRRLSFDLTGLPPTSEEVTAFLNDRSLAAYEQAVDRLLNRQAFGERMAVDWLDAARYSDTYGYQVDRDRYVWPWRDWVIKAFNDNLPYDQFITWQLAGDLLPRATDLQIQATTFNRLHPQKVEGGSVPEEFRTEYVADRNHTFATVFLGLTLECCRCHDHKYDPITQREYYQLFAYFNNIDESGLYSYFTNSVPTPTMLLADQKTKDKIAANRQRIQQAVEHLQRLATDRMSEFDRWLTERPGVPDVLPGQVAYLDFEAKPGGANVSVPGKVGRAIELSGDDGVGVGAGNFKRTEPFSVAFWVQAPEEKERAVIFHRSRAWTDAGSRGYQLLLENGQLSASLIHFWPGNAIRIRSRVSLPVKRWVHVGFTYDGSSRAAGLRLFIDGQPTETYVVQDQLAKNITGGGGDNITIGQRFRDRGFSGGRVDEFRVFSRRLAAIEIGHLFDGNSLRDLLRTPADKLKRGERELLQEYYLATFDEVYLKQLQTVKELRQAGSSLVDPVQEVMVMRERRQRRPTFVLKRGAYDAPMDEVRPGTPAIFPAPPDDAPRNRLGLTQWLTQPSHPLTARVAVNRFWQMLFGQGLVRTPEDFGSQGNPPTHPQLLDWLAVDFVEHGWNVKRLAKQMVMSATYRQSSALRPELRKKDPGNLLLARAPSYRWPAEMIRDNALAVSGLLTTKVGGPPARPYELTVSFKPIKQDKGPGLYRRSLYTFWKRTAPAPVMMTLDAAKRDVCMVQRERTASPLQALVLLNDPQLLEAARVLGARMLGENDQDVTRSLRAMFQALTSRIPGDAEMRVLQDLFAEQYDFYQQHPGEAEKFMSVGDAPRNSTLPAPLLAAMGVLANTVMNLDQCVVKR